MNMAVRQTVLFREPAPVDTVWTVLDAANDLSDTQTVDACRRVIDANLRGQEGNAFDLAIVAAFFG
jgi:hypothetical protein